MALYKVNGKTVEASTVEQAIQKIKANDSAKEYVGCDAEGNRFYFKNGNFFKDNIKIDDSLIKKAMSNIGGNN